MKDITKKVWTSETKVQNMNTKVQTVHKKVQTVQKIYISFTWHHMYHYSKLS